MKILQINKYDYRKGGSETHFFDLIDLLRSKGHEVSVFTARGNSGDMELPELISFDKFSLRNILKMLWNHDAVRKLDAVLASEKPDIAHLHNIYHHLSPAIIHLLKKRRIPIAMTLHDYKIICPNYKLFNQGKICEKCKGGKYYHCLFDKCVKGSRAKSLLAMIEAYLHRKMLKSYEKVDIFIAPSRFIKDKFVEFGVPAEKIEVIHNFVSLRPAKSVEKQENYILYFGRLSEEKGIDSLVEAMAYVNGDIRLKIVGNGETKKNLKSEDRIEVLGYMDGVELTKAVSGAIAVVIPSVWYENMPLSMLEAMAAGKAVIAADIGGIPEIIRDGENGFLFEAGNANELAEKINDAVSMNLSGIGKKAIDTVKSFDREAYHKEIEKLYHAIK